MALQGFWTKRRRFGIDGLILPDVPYEEKEEFAPLCEAAGLDLISMIAPTSHDRIKMIAAEAKGFVYCVSSLGVTGVRSEITTDIGAMVRLVKEANPDIPCAVGFGISTPAQAEKMAAVSDGAIVGSAIVRLCEKYGREAAGPIGEYVRSMKVAVLQKRLKAVTKCRRPTLRQLSINSFNKQTAFNSRSRLDFSGCK